MGHKNGKFSNPGSLDITKGLAELSEHDTAAKGQGHVAKFPVPLCTPAARERQVKQLKPARHRKGLDELEDYDKPAKGQCHVVKFSVEVAVSPPSSTGPRGRQDVCPGNSTPPPRTAKRRTHAGENPHA